jgi:hypothetical protein
VLDEDLAVEVSDRDLVALDVDYHLLVSVLSADDVGHPATA